MRSRFKGLPIRVEQRDLRANLPLNFSIVIQVDGAPSPRRADFGLALPAWITRDENADFESYDE